MKRLLVLVILLVSGFVHAQYEGQYIRSRHQYNDMLVLGTQMVITGTWTCAGGSKLCTSGSGAADTELNQGDKSIIVMQDTSGNWRSYEVESVTDANNFLREDIVSSRTVDALHAISASDVYIINTGYNDVPYALYDGLGIGGALQVSPKAVVVVGTDIAVVPWTVNTITGQTADIAKFQVNGVDKAYITSGGYIHSPRVFSTDLKYSLTAAGLNLANDVGVLFSSTGTYSGTKDLALTRYNDGVYTWLQIPTGRGLVADNVRLGTGGPILRGTLNNLIVRNTADTDSGSINAGTITTNGHISSLTTLPLQVNNFSSADNMIEVATGTFSNTTGTSAALAILPTYNQTSGDASNTDFLVNRTETAIGSGLQNLMDLQVGGISKTSVSSLGTLTTGYISAAGHVSTTAVAYGFGSSLAIFMNGNNGIQIGNALKIGWSTSAIYSHGKILELGVYNDGTDDWLNLSIGKGVRTDRIMFNPGGNGSAGYVAYNYDKFSFLAADGVSPTRTYASHVQALSQVWTPEISTVASESTLKIQTYGSDTAINVVEMATGTFSNTTGTSAAVAILPIYNQVSGDAVNTDFLVNRTETAVGSGTQLLADFQVGGVSKFYVRNDGLIRPQNVWVQAAYHMGTGTYGTGAWMAGTTGQVMNSTYKVAWTNTAGVNGTQDLALTRYWDGSFAYLDISTGQGIRVPIGSAANPSYAFPDTGSGTIGFFGRSSNSIGLVMQNGERFYFATTQFQSSISGSFGLLTRAASAIVPTLSPDNVDFNTGIGGAVGYVSLIATSTEVARFMLDGSSNPVAKVMSVLGIVERSSDPAEPAEGECVTWLSDGTQKGDDGDLLIACQAGGATTWGTLFDKSAGAAW